MQSVFWLVASGMLQQPLADTEQGQRPPRAIEYSNFYTLRATIHRDASYATLPLFGEGRIGGT